MIPGDWKLVVLGPIQNLGSKPRKDPTLESSRIREDPNGTTDLASSYPHMVDSLLDHLVKYSQVKLACALAIPPSEPQ